MRNDDQNEGLAERVAMIAGLAEPVRPGWAHTDGIVDLKENPTKRDDLVSVEDRALIEEMFARYGIAFDDRRLNALSSLFTEDVSYEIVCASKDVKVEVAEGRDELLANTQEAWRLLNDQRRHHLTNVVLDKVDDEHVKAIAYGIVVLAGNPNVLAATAVYSADVVLVDAQWRFSKFIIATDAYQGR